MEFLSKLYKKFIIGDIKNTEEEPDVDEWIRFLRSLPAAHTVYDESFNKYACRNSYYGKGKQVLLNIGSFLYLILLLPRIMFHSAKVLTSNSAGKAIIEVQNVPYKDILPNALSDRFNIVEVDRTAVKIGFLTREGKKILHECYKAHPFSFYYLLWIIKELSAHSYYLSHYETEAAIVYVNERNVAGPLLTELYEGYGRKFISFMHGEYLFQIIQAYMHFSQYYVWDKCYADMFSDDLKCNKCEFVVYRPKRLEKKWDLERVEPEYYCTYYFSGESTDSIKKISEIFNKFEANGKKCKVRPHPRYSHWGMIRSMFEGVCVEEPSEVSMEESLASTRYAVGLSTTVLSEAYIEGRQVVIDDVSNVNHFNNLEKRKCIHLMRPHKLLSELIVLEEK